MKSPSVGGNESLLRHDSMRPEEKGFTPARSPHAATPLATRQLLAGRRRASSSDGGPARKRALYPFG
jgi:hypothetical protein